MTSQTFQSEISAAISAFDKYIICLGKSREDFEAALGSLMLKAINAYENRPPGMRHGIALDPHVTIILSQSDGAKPLCGIYFNLHSPYQKSSLPSTVQRMNEPVSEETKETED
ncbi:MAG: hypothetical protein EPO07_17910 [Verrucomicrobia bacterium]|nr:MAG: hypothetical protein EPO07_17910 [Verrucomicrobiota bacterium]